jgi:hypothetical protein
MDGILYLKLFAGFLDDLRNRGIVDVTDSREQMMLDLEVQPPDQPCNHSVISGEIHSRFDLMNRPVVLDPTRAIIGQRKIRVFHTVRQLKHNAECDALHKGRYEITEQHRPDAAK